MKTFEFPINYVMSLSLSRLLLQKLLLSGMVNGEQIIIYMFNTSRCITTIVQYCI